MYVTYKPEDGEVQEWEFHPDRVRVSEQVMVEKRAGVRWDEWVQGVKLGRAESRRVLLWHLIRRRHPGLRWDDTPDFYAGELVVEQSVAELERNREAWVAAGGEANDDAPMVSAMFEREIEAARKSRGDEAAGKAPSSS